MDYYSRGHKIRKILFPIFFFSLFIYAFFNSRNLLLGPVIDLTYPEGNIEVREKIITMKGRARNSTFLSLNDRQIQVDTDGFFSESLLLYPGYNMIQFYSKDRFGKHIEKTIEVYYSPIK